MDKFLCLLHTFPQAAIIQTGFVFSTVNYRILIPIFLLSSCSLRPGSLSKLEEKGVFPANQADSVKLSGSGKYFDVVYLGCGGLYLIHNGEGLLVDPFFSNQKAERIGRSVLLSRGKKTFQSNRAAVTLGLDAIRASSPPDLKVNAILNTHSHYDHLMDIPVVWQQLPNKPPVLLSSSGFNTCHAVIDTSAMVRLEDYMSTTEVTRNPWQVRTAVSRINIYPILADHNPHFRHVSFFEGAHTRPVASYRDAWGRTDPNLWLEGKTVSFLIDYLAADGSVELRIFVQSSSCNPPAGIPPSALLKERQVDIAFLGVASYRFSPDYPCEWLEMIRPREVVWIHWEDFFRKYGREPKTLRGSDVPGFFQIPCVEARKEKGKIVWPRTKIPFVY